MAFPPNYRQERSNRTRKKEQKALEKQQKRDEKAARRKSGRFEQDDNPAPDTPADQPE